MKAVSNFLRAMLAIVWKDLAAEWRSRELISAMLVFALLVIFIFNFALELTPQTRNDVTSGVLWVTLTFAGTLGLNRSMAVEKDRGCLDGLLLAPVDRTATTTCLNPGPGAVAPTPPVIHIRQVTVTLTGQLRADPTVTRTLTESVRLRNDWVEGSCPT